MMGIPLTAKQKRFGLNQNKYFVTKDRGPKGDWIVYVPTLPTWPGDKVVNRFPTHSQCIGFINWREKTNEL